MLRPRLFWIFLLTAGALHGGTVPGLILPLHDVEVGTAATGIVAEVLVKEGDTVTKEQPLVRLNDEVEKLDVERMIKVLEKAKFDHEAAQKLLAEKIGTREEALRKQIEHDLARLQKAGGRGQAETAHHQRADSRHRGKAGQRTWRSCFAQ